MTEFLPFTRPNIDEDSIAAVAAVLRSGQLASGPKVLAFEAALAAYIGAGRQVRVLTSATEGLEIALSIAGVRSGDEVIVPAMSFSASANVIARLGATPKFVDIELHSRNIDIPAEPGRPSLYHRLRSQSRLHQRDGADLRSQLPHHQIQAQPHREQPGICRNEPSAVAL